MTFDRDEKKSLSASLLLASKSEGNVLGVIRKEMEEDVMALQQFDRQPIYTEVNPGEDKKLDCIVLNKRGSCSWQKDNKPVGIYAKKYEWAGRQEDGDCSLWIRQASLDFDDGAWECQVTASDFITQDALTSNPVRLVVRVRIHARAQLKVTALCVFLSTIGHFLALKRRPQR
ncbi:unnamed protein product [Bemisia tabaci]|uniref:Immunoglobulin I-set domain-containing protein n=1 Tax=Bemisia tabaci TaxID=7038 RepID=A0A9P0AGX8_BEMTA|nr:unnamed protein product [Bemisia tabaci]